MSDPDESGAGEFADEGSPSHDGGGDDAGDPFPTFVCRLAPPKAASRTLARRFAALAVVLAASALWAHEAGHPNAAELAALGACLVLAVAIPARELARRYGSYPDRSALVLGREGFRLPWLLDSDAPGPEGPWECLRSYRVARSAGPSRARTLLLEVAAGRLRLSEDAIGSPAFDAALAALERALGPGGVFLGTVVRLPIHPPDERSLWARSAPLLPAIALALAFIGLGAVASSLAVRLLSGLLAVLWLWIHLVRGYEAPRRADLALGLDGLCAPLPEDPRRAIKVPFDSVRSTAVVEDGPDRRVLVIEHERGRLSYPLDWLDERHTRAFAKALQARRRSGD